MLIFIVIRVFLRMKFIFCYSHLVVDFEIFSTNINRFNFIILLDRFRIIFLWTVIIISARVFTFRSSYIRIEKFYNRFHFLLLSFVLSMVILILRPNLISILLGWDGLGVRSYLLVIYYSRRKSFNAGIITFARNRVGDALIIVRIRYFVYMANLNIFIIFYLEDSEVYWVFIIIIIAACIIRAQILFGAWPW